MLRWLLRILIGLVIFVVVFVVAFLIVVGPWPVYGPSPDVTQEPYYQRAIANISANAASNNLTGTPGRLQAGWAHRDITPPIGAPLGGYGDRGMTHHSTGVRDKLEVQTLALGDGIDTVVLVGADMLITPPHIAEAVRANVAAQVPQLTPDDILFNASHTHCGPGGFGEGLGMRVTGGQYTPEVPELLIKQYTEAIVAAYQAMEPAKLAHGSVDAPEYIRNRAREAPTDSELSFAVVEQDDGDQCYLVSFSAHPTNFGGSMLEFSAEYPGELRRYIEGQTSEAAVYLGGAVGSMGPRAPEGPTPSDRVRLMGQALAKLVLDASKDLEFSDRLDVASIGVPVDMPPLQLRPFEGNTKWRVSPIFAKMAFSPYELNGWLHGARVGDLVWMGMPCDFSGEISIVWKEYAELRGFDLWNLSFCGTYCGYFSPDKYYDQTPLGYETGFMSWFGPDIEKHFTGLFHHMLDALKAPVAETAGVAAAR